MKQPNIIFMITDDQGYESLSCNGADSLRTPYIDQLAATGINFRHCHATPLCTPSRAMAMTGKYPFRTNMLTLMNTSSDRFLSPSFPTMASVLRAAGYHCAAVGKWHLANFQTRPNHAYQLGFDEYNIWTREKEKYQRYWNPVIKQNGRYLHELETFDHYGPDKQNEFAIDFIKRHQERPFFLYYAMTLPHTLFTPTPDSENLALKDKRGIRSGPEAVLNFQDMVMYADKLVGQLVSTLDDLGLRENTLIIFTSDHGTNHYVGTRLKDGRWISGHKGDIRGGTRVPCIVNWKGVTPIGEVKDDLIDFTDFLVTFADVANAKLPEDEVFDGKSFLPQIRGEAGTPREWAFSQFYRWWCIVGPRWKLVMPDNELVDMHAYPFDPAEPIIAKETPETVAVRRQLLAWLQELNPGPYVPDDAIPPEEVNRMHKFESRMNSRRRTSHH